MDIGTIGGLVLACVMVVASVLMGGASPMAFVDIPSIMVVFGGTLGAIAIGFPMPRLTKLHSVMLKAAFAKSPDLTQLIRDIVRYAEVARRDGILALENLTGEMSDEFLIRGVKMAVDGTDPDLIRTILDSELEALMDRHAGGKQMLDAIGKYAPAYGMIGTLLGLVTMLQNMQDPSAIGPGMAVALITTLYGALISNIATGPIADKLAQRDAEEVMVRNLIITGVMSIQSGDNPRVVESKLMTYLPAAARESVSQEAA